MSKMTQDEYREEFALMVDEITSKNGVRYDALCRISESFLRPYINRQCSGYRSLRSLGIEDDIYHDVILCLIKSCVDKFFYRDDTLNNDAEGFLKWIYTVARNAVTDAAKKHGNKSIRETDLVNDEGEIIDIPDSDNPLVSVEMRETLRECFDALLDNDSALYIRFTWLLRAILLCQCDTTAINDSEKEDIVGNKINSLIADTFEKLTLNEIFAIILLQSRDFAWMKFDEADCRKIAAALAETTADGVPLGERKYGDFFMKKGGKATISDWINRMNMRILKIVNA